MVAKDYRQIAWKALSGKWGIMALITLVYTVLVGICGAIPAVGSTALLLITGPLALGFANVSLAVVRGGDVRVEMLFDGFKNFVSAFLLNLINTLLVMLWSLLLIVPGIIKAYAYAMSTYILAENPEMSQKECRKLSQKMMEGNKWRLFCLHFSFIGWALLCTLTFGVLTFWVEPYMQVSTAAFYEELKKNQTYQCAEEA